jgi:phosphomannomutase
MEVRIEKGKYDFGLATDGDSDRMALIDEGGKFIDYNDVLKLLYYYLKEYRKDSGGIVRNIATTHILDKMADYYGEKAYEVPVGFKNISKKMKEHDLLLGGESSGGLKIRGHVNGKDGILASLLAVEMMARTGKKIGNILAEIDQKFGSLYFSCANFNYEPSQRKRLEKLLFEDEYQPDLSNLIENSLISNKKLLKISYLDGVKYYYNDQNWISIRFSGTEPLLRLYMEMKNEAEVKEILKFLKSDLGI